MKKKRPQSDEAWQKLIHEAEQARARCEQRREAMPTCHFPQQLPISEHVESIQKLLQQHQLIVVCGETGSGKSTQLPKICLQAGFGIKGMIGHTQPRRLAARTIASRLTQEIETDNTKKVGYKIRHNDRTDDSTLIKVMTDGILLAELQQDHALMQYEVLIIDEAHERSLNIDFILGYLHQLIKKRPELRVIITSATIDVERIGNHFSNAPVVEVSGRTYPVEVRYRPFDDEEGQDDELIRGKALLDAIKELEKDGWGDILVFLDGEREIHDMAKYLEKCHLNRTEILPLYARLSSVRQAKIFQPHQKRHIILATNIAETSLTIDGVRYVIDFGYARISRYSYRSKVQRLPIEKVSQASANQRKGRCGRVAEGICIRLYAEEDFNARPEYTDPEILRTNLASVILQMKSLQLGDIQDYPFIDAPDQKFVRDGLRLLSEIGALNDAQELTGLGRQLARLPLDPRHARILLAAGEWNCLKEILIIISALSIQDPRERPIEEPGKADESHAQYHDEKSDFLWFINFWNFYRAQAKKLSRNQLQKLCKQQYVSFLRMREWQDIHRQLQESCSELKLNINAEPCDYNQLHCALLTGLLGHVATKTDAREYTGARSVKLNIFPGSAQFSRLPKWFVAAELVETSRLYARNVASIDPNWLLKIAKHLLQTEFFEPHWDAKRQQVMIYEKVSLFGLIIVPRRAVSFGKIDRVEARTLFIQQALVERQLDTQARFFQHNEAIIERVSLLERKTRRADIFDAEKLYDFYHKRLGDDISSLQSLDKWRKIHEREDARILFITEDDILRQQDDDISVEQFPDQITINNIPMPLDYAFNPGQEDDGISVEIPVHALNQIDERIFEKVVPGVFAEKIACLIRSLPKQLRKQLIPVPDVAKECASQLSVSDSTLIQSLSDYIFRTRAIKIEADQWNSAEMPEHLMMKFKVVDADGETLAMSRSLKKLKESLEEHIDEHFSAEQIWPIEQTNIQSWDFGELPYEVTADISNIHLQGYPALSDEGESVSIKVCDTPEKAVRMNHAGLRRLILLRMAKDIKYLMKNMPAINKMSLLYTRLGKTDDLKNSIVLAVIEKVFLDDRPFPRTESEFETLVTENAGKLVSCCNDICESALHILSKHQDIRVLLKSFKRPADIYLVQDVQQQLDMMIYPGFIAETHSSQLQHLPRYLTAIEKRLDKAKLGSAKDKQNTREIGQYVRRYEDLAEADAELANVEQELHQLRWMLEEYRVSLFAQELKTVIPVSAKRLDELIRAIRKVKS